jgi:hypothetical protein
MRISRWSERSSVWISAAERRRLRSVGLTVSLIALRVVPTRPSNNRPAIGGSVMPLAGFADNRSTRPLTMSGGRRGRLCLRRVGTDSDRSVDGWLDVLSVLRRGFVETPRLPSSIFIPRLGRATRRRGLAATLTVGVRALGMVAACRGSLAPIRHSWRSALIGGVVWPL